MLSSVFVCVVLKFNILFVDLFCFSVNVVVPLCSIGCDRLGTCLGTCTEVVVLPFYCRSPKESLNLCSVAILLGFV